MSMSKLERDSEIHWKQVTPQNKDFSDQIYGTINFPPPLTNIIDTPQFQRLRDIKQLGLTDRVYPSACHTRFVHSLGVCYLAGELLTQIRQRQPDLNISDVDLLCVQIAALCHDLGHGPFSHFFDNLVMAKFRPNLKWKHEEGSVLMLKYMRKKNPDVEMVLRKYLSDRDFTFIEEMIRGSSEKNKGKEWEYEGRGQDQSFLYDIVSNKHDGLDVDRFDYFRRDSVAARIGVTFEETSRMRLFNNARVYMFEGQLRICYAEKVKNDVYTAAHTRFRLHKIVYQHKTIRACEYLMLEAIKLADKHVTFLTDSGHRLSITEAVTDMSAFVQLNDSVVHTIRYLSTLEAFKDNSDLQKSVHLLDKMEKRSFPKSVGHAIVCSNNNSEVESLSGQMIRDQIVAKGANGTLCRAKDIEVFVTKLHYGMGDENPLILVPVYNHKDLNETSTRRLTKEEYDGELPETFGIHDIQVFCHREDSSTVNEVYALFSKYCDEKHMTPQKRPCSNSEKTPPKFRKNLQESLDA